MSKSHACEKKWSKYAKELTLSNNCKFMRSSRIVVQPKTEPFYLAYQFLGGIKGYAICDKVQFFV